MNPTSVLPAIGNDAIEILINDHGTIKQLLNQLNESPASSRKSTLAQLKGVLTVHNATEETIVYPALALQAGKKMKAHHLYHETAEADIVLFHLETLLEADDAGDEFAKLAKTFQAAILEHIDDEEDAAFPKLREHASQEQSAALAASVRKFREELDVRPNAA